MVLPQLAEARIVYTPAHVVIWEYGVRLYDLDLNHDGKTDFVLQTKFYFTLNQSAGTQRLIASGAKGNGLEPAQQGFAAALQAGKEIGPHQRFERRGVMASDYGRFGSTTSLKRGPWINAKDRYLGLKFKIDGKVHFGWARLTVRTESAWHFVRATLTGYAYETIPNKPVITGKTKGPDVVTVAPGSLGKLALGRK